MIKERSKILRVQITIFSILAGLLGISLLIVFIDGLSFNSLGLSFYEEYFFRYLAIFILFIVEIYGLVKTKKWAHYLGFALLGLVFIYTLYNILMGSGPVVDRDYTILPLSALRLWYYVWLLESLLLVAILPLASYLQYKLYKESIK